MPPAQADTLLQQAITALSLSAQDAAAIYAAIDQIIDYLNQLRQTVEIGIGTTGTILERLCGYGLQAAISNTTANVQRVPRQWKWVGDFSLPGDPFNVVISCKSFKARERLLASGSGTILAPVLGWGYFNAPEEFTQERIVSYAYKGFMSIYMPDATLQALAPQARDFTNINGRPLLRSLPTFVNDVRGSINGTTGRINPRLL